MHRELYRHPDVRRGIEDRKSELTFQKGQAESAHQMLSHTEERYNRDLRVYLGTQTDDPLARRTEWLENILESAEREEVDSEWLYAVVNNAAMRVEKVSASLYPRELGVDNEHESLNDEYISYVYALHLITLAEQSIYPYYSPVQEVLKEVEQLAQAREASQEVRRDRRMSVAYRWMHQNLDVLFKIHHDYWSAHSPK
ncbi:hypothetical protein HYV21_00395 [Candidatus Microgenomates bacterium]|nr:hypothetical protein [Candidatus Microgenomates bacterium]